MKVSEVKLTGNGMANIPRSKIQNDFEFIVGDSHYPYPCFVADFLSPKIGRLQALDPSINDYYLEVNDPQNQFGEFLSLGFGSDIQIDQPTVRSLCSTSRELDHREVYELYSIILKVLSPFQMFLNNFISLICSTILANPLLIFLPHISLDFFPFLYLIFHMTHLLTFFHIHRFGSSIRSMA
jgi:hypothetical protein